MNMKRVLAILFAFALLASACGSGGDDGDAVSSDGETGTDDAADDAAEDDAAEDDGDDAMAEDAAEDDAMAEDAAEDHGGDEGTDGDDAPTDDAAEDGSDDGSGEDELAALRVPEDFASIQDAVDAAVPGDLILIGAGVYNEAVQVETENIVIRGADRNETILDGQNEMENGIIVFSNGVAVENLTARNYNSNGVFFTGDYDSDFVLEGYRASYVTVHNNGDYGIYAFNAANGLIEHSYGSGQPDSAFYIGQCQPCNAVITDSLAENNALGYSGTNAGGELYIINSEWRNNRVGIVPNSLNSEELAPQRSAVFAGNYVHNNGNLETPRKGADWDLAFGVGIVVAGGENDLITKNRAVDNLNVGIAVAIFPDGDTIWVPSNNQVIDNVATGQPYDLAFLPGGGQLGNCFAGNTFETSAPADIETMAPCDGEGPTFTDLYPIPSEAFSTIEHTEVPVPGPQPQMPDALTAPADPAIDPFVAPDMGAITVPDPS